MGLSDAFAALPGLVQRARDGDRGAYRTLMFPYHYGQKIEDGVARPYTEEEILEAHNRLMGEK